MNTTSNVSVTHLPDADRFIIEIGDGTDVPELLYDINDQTIRMKAVRVPSALRKQGYASKLTQTALEYAKREQLRVIPICPFVQWYLKQNPEYQTLVRTQT